MGPPTEDTVSGGLRGTGPTLETRGKGRASTRTSHLRRRRGALSSRASHRGVRSVWTCLGLGWESTEDPVDTSQGLGPGSRRVRYWDGSCHTLETTGGCASCRARGRRTRRLIRVVSQGLGPQLGDWGPNWVTGVSQGGTSVLARVRLEARGRGLTRGSLTPFRGTPLPSRGEL